jgi:uncharacterized protein (DUF2237 family)
LARRVISLRRGICCDRGTADIDHAEAATINADLLAFLNAYVDELSHMRPSGKSVE